MLNMQGRCSRPLLWMVAGLAAMLIGVGSDGPPAAAQTASWIATFDGSPGSPRPYNPTNWDVLVHSRDYNTWKQLEPMAAHHGSDCGAAPATHQISAYPDAVFQCNDHLMTAINAGGYGLIVLTPNQLVDFAAGEAIVRFDMTTFRSSGRDWVSLWLSPFEDQIPLPLRDWLPDLAGEPRRAISIDMESFNALTVFRGRVSREYAAMDLNSIWWLGYESFLTPSAVRRDTFELRISRTSLKFGLPAYNRWWVDTSFSDLGWDRAVLQLTHHSYNPTKDCTNCGPNTWHWDNVSISRAVPFTMLKGDLPWVDPTSRSWVSFPTGAPANGFLRFVGIGNSLQVSFDGGQSWQAARMHSVEKQVDEVFKPYWMPVPPGTTRVDFRGSNWWGGTWMVRGVSIWSQADPLPPPTSNCSTRPRTVIQTQAIGGGKLQVTATVGRPSGASNNIVRRVQIVRADNAQVEILGQTFGAGGGSLIPPAASQSVTFTVTRQPAGAPVAVTVPFEVADDCGAWKTFVGGGPTAF